MNDEEKIDWLESICALLIVAFFFALAIWSPA